MLTRIFVQARMGSTRLPGKVLMEVAGKPIIRHVLDRCKGEYPVHLLTTDRDKDDTLCRLAHDLGIDYFRGSESNVIGRFYNAHFRFPSDVIVRVTGDCPCICREVISFCVNKLTSEHLDLVYTTGVDGLDVEVFTSLLLVEANTRGKKPHDREHVTPWMMRNARCKAPVVVDGIPVKLSVDTLPDLQRVREVYRVLGDSFGVKEIRQWANGKSPSATT